MTETRGLNICTTHQLVESATDLLGEMLSPDGLKGPMSMGRFDVTDNHDGRCLDDGDGFDDFLLGKY